MLLPTIFYIDAANTGHFADLPIMAAKISLGIFTRRARDQDHFWRILGFLPAIAKHKSTSERIMTNSQHIDSVIFASNQQTTTGFYAVRYTLSLGLPVYVKFTRNMLLRRSKKARAI